jgi:Domain of unknown function (DUF4157)
MRGFASQQRIQTRIRSPTASVAQLRAQATIYRQGRTPVVDAAGRVSPWDRKPAGPQLTGRQLGEVRNRFGGEGLGRSVHALSISRGPEFVEAAMRHAPASVRRQSEAVVAECASGHGAHTALKKTRGGATDEQQDEVLSAKNPAAELKAAGTGRPLRAAERRPLESWSGHDLSKVRIIEDMASHRTADLLGARAFTIGRSIYMGRDEYRPATATGRDLLAHETAHAVQQEEASTPALEQLSIGRPGTKEEREAGAFAQAFRRGEPARQLLSAGSTKVARLMCALSFRRTSDTITTNNPTKNEPAGGTDFEVGRGHGGTHFDWDTEVEVTGDPGDSYADWEVGHLQIVRQFWKNVYWGTGTNRTHQRRRVDPLPSRDSDPGMVWYDDPSASPRFAASGDKRTANLNDSPGTRIDFANPVAGRTGTRGWFNWGAAFVTWSSVRDTTGPNTNASFRHLGHVYWNIMLDGNWDTTQAIGSRVNLGTAVTNTSAVFDGQGSSHTPIITGTVASASFKTSTT